MLATTASFFLLGSLTSLALFFECEALGIVNLEGSQWCHCQNWGWRKLDLVVALALALSLPLPALAQTPSVALVASDPATPSVPPELDPHHVRHLEETAA